MKPVSFFESVNSKSNDCTVADGHLLPTHYDLFKAIDVEVDKYRMLYDHVRIPLTEVTSYREFHNNVPTFGDALEELLREKIEGYEGMDESSNIQLTDEEKKVKVTIIESFATEDALFYFYTTQVKTNG